MRGSVTNSTAQQSGESRTQLVQCSPGGSWYVRGKRRGLRASSTLWLLHLSRLGAALAPGAVQQLSLLQQLQTPGEVAAEEQVTTQLAKALR